MASGPLAAVVVVLIFAGASFFFALAETALFSLSKWQVRQLAEREPRAGGIVARLLAEPQDLLATMVLGNTFASAAMLAVALWMAIHGHWPLAATVAGLLALILIGCEVLPKTLAVRRPEQWALRVARPLALVLRFSLPLCRVAQKVNAAILRAVIPRTVQPHVDADGRGLPGVAGDGVSAGHAGAVGEGDHPADHQPGPPHGQGSDEAALADGGISDDLSIEEMIAAARKHKHRRLPIYDETPDTIVGILNTRALLLDPQIDLADAIEFPSFVPETMNLLQLFKSLQRQQRGLAIVLDEFGGTAGIVTMEDILEELIGKIHGEAEAEGFVMEKLGPGRWRVTGTLRLDDFRREYPALGDVPEVETMGGLLTQPAGRGAGAGANRRRSAG